MSGRKILFVDDDKDFLELISDFFEKEEINCVYATSLRDAIAKCGNEKFKLIVTDFALGNHTCKELINLTKNPGTMNYGTPVILISGEIRSEQFKDLMKSIKKALVKPFQPAKLVEIIKTIAS